MSVKRRLAGQPDARGASASGQTTTEFLMIGGAVAAILLVVLVSFGGQVSSALTILGRCLSSAAGGSTAGCAAGGSAAASAASPGKPAGTLPSVFGPAGAPAGNTGSPAPGGPGAPSGGLGTGSGGRGPGGGPGGAGGPGGGAPTGLPGTMGGPLVTLPPPGSVAVGPIQPKSPYSQLIEDAYNTVGIGVHYWEWNSGSSSLVASRYGNWYGQGWWGGSELDDRVGPLPPVDWLDAAAQKHDFGYQIADEMGEIYGEAEKFRLRALADEAAARDAARLPDDPREWKPPPADIEEARRARDRLVAGFSQVTNNVNRARSMMPECDLCPPPTAGPMSARGLEAEQQRRVDVWNQDFRTRQAEWLKK